MEIRAPAQFPRARLPDVPDPPTVGDPQNDRESLLLSLDDAIRLALENSEVVRVLTGAGAASSGSTIYDPAIANTQIDEARGAFDPRLGLGNRFDRIETPRAFGPAPDVVIDGDRLDQYRMDLGLSKTTASGGTASLGVLTTPQRSTADGLLLNPETSSSVDLGFRQPLLQGAGARANLAPIEIARIDTERSFYQFQQSVQSLVRGVIEAYWALVFARTEVWARQQQAEQGDWASVLAEANFKAGRGNAGDVALARSSAANFRANLITARASLIRREAALRNILGLPPADHRQIVPVTPPATEWIGVDWQTVLRTAEVYRPDLIERKLQIEADRQQLVVAENNALPAVDATALYRWNGLSGTAPDGSRVVSDPGQFTGWQLGIDVAVPLGLRQSRAALRARELALMRDRANLEQALHNAAHLLAESYRNLAQFFEQYRAFQETRAAARLNLDAQSARWRAQVPGTNYLDVLQGVTSWGNAVDSEAQALLEYNTALATLDEQMGTILEVHGIRFTEVRYCSIGPAGRLVAGRWYPRDRRPGENEDRYPRGREPAENAFELDAPPLPRSRDAELQRPSEVPFEELMQPPPAFGSQQRPAPQRLPAPAP